MKKLLLSGALIFTGAITSFSQSTATEFNVNDCAGTSHDLFTELNAGKVVVISFVMPCGACIGPSLTAYNTVAGYASSNPGRVVFYLSDQGTCTSLDSWKNTNSMPTATTFADPAVTPANYGGVAMPRIVVLGGTSHTVFYNQTSGVTAGNLQPAINSALAATGISEYDNSALHVNLFPSPAVDAISVSYTLAHSGDVSFEIFNALGAKVMTVSLAQQSVGKHEEKVILESNLSSGNYFLKLNAGTLSHTVKFTVTR